MFRTIQAQSHVGHNKMMRLSSRMNGLSHYHHQYRSMFNKSSFNLNPSNNNNNININHYFNLINKINKYRFSSSIINQNKSVIKAMNEWLPSINTIDILKNYILYNNTNNSSKTPRGFGQFSKKTSKDKSTKKTDTKSSDNEPITKQTDTDTDTTTSATATDTDPNTQKQTDPNTKTNTKKSKKDAKVAKKDGSDTDVSKEKKGKLFSTFNKDKQSGSSSGQSGKQWYEQIPTWVYFTPLILLLIGPNMTYKTSSNQITFQQFKIHMLEQGLVDHIEVVNKTIARVFLRNNMTSSSIKNTTLDDRVTDDVYGNYSPSTVYEFNIGDIQIFEEKLESAQINMGIESRDWVPVQYISEISIRDSLLSFVSSGPILTLLIFWWIIRMFRRSGALPGSGAGGGGASGGGGFKGGFGGPMSSLFDVTKANYKLINKGEKVKTKFNDVAGLDNAKEEVAEFVHFLKDPSIYTKLGARIPKGALLSGPPGCGKTLLARAVAGEAECPFFSISGSDFVEMFVGVGPSRVRNLFEEARKNAPCIVFIDEIDAVGRKRGRGGFAGGNDERENTLNQLLVEMDGFKSDSNIVVLAGTNRADILDSALTRPGRFDRQINIDKPDIKGRIEIFKVHMKNIKLSPSTSTSDDNDEEEEEEDEDEHEQRDLTIYNDVAARMATLTPGFSGADISNVVNEAALRAARKMKDYVDINDFYEANDRVIGGLEKRISSMTLKEKEMIAYHEAGHAVAGWFLENAEPLLKVTIIPRASGALGFAQYLPKELQLYNKEQLYDMMCMALGGRAAEEIFYNKVSTGAADDLNKVTKIAYGQISVYGMNDKLGNLSFPPENNDGMQSYRPYSEKTAELIDNEASILVKNAYKDTLNLLTKYRDNISKLAIELLEKETIGHEDIIAVLGERPFKNDAYKAYLENTKEWQNKYDQQKEEEKEKEKEEQNQQDINDNDNDINDNETKVTEIIDNDNDNDKDNDNVK